jgi:hypothetical protein
MDQDWDIYQVGLSLGAVRDFLRTSPEHTKQRYQQLERAMATVAVLTGGHHVPSLSSIPTDSDEYFLGCILLGILQRGRAPLASPCVERTLLTKIVGGLDTEDLSDRNDFRFGFRVQGESRDAFAQALCNGLILSDARTSPDWSREFGNYSERRFVDEYLAPLLGAGISLVEAQRPLESMLESEDGTPLREFIGQRVDFAIESPTGAKLVIEVDGPSHHTEAQKRLEGVMDFGQQG